MTCHWPYGLLWSSEPEVIMISSWQRPYVDNYTMLTMTRCFAVGWRRRRTRLGRSQAQREGARACPQESERRKFLFTYYIHLKFHSLLHSFTHRVCTMLYFGYCPQRKMQTWHLSLLKVSLGWAESCWNCKLFRWVLWKTRRKLPRKSLPKCNEFLLCISHTGCTVIL